MVSVPSQSLCKHSLPCGGGERVEAESKHAITGVRCKGQMYERSQERALDRTLHSSCNIRKCQRQTGIGGSVVEFSPATREARVRFPANASTIFFFFKHVEQTI